MSVVTVEQATRDTVFRLEKIINQMNNTLIEQSKKIDEINKNLEETNKIIESIKEDGFTFKPGVYLN